MAVIWHDEGEVTLLCHEDDHSCYEQFQCTCAYDRDGELTDYFSLGSCPVHSAAGEPRG